MGEICLDWNFDRQPLDQLQKHNNRIYFNYRRIMVFLNGRVSPQCAVKFLQFKRAQLSITCLVKNKKKNYFGQVKEKMCV